VLSMGETRMIAEQLGWYSYFHPAMRRDNEHYGNAVLSRYPLSFRRAVELPGRAPFFCREDFCTHIQPMEPLAEFLGKASSHDMSLGKAKGVICEILVDREVNEDTCTGWLIQRSSDSLFRFAIAGS
jgi:hypothetical protein